MRLLPSSSLTAPIYLPTSPGPTKHPERPGFCLMQDLVNILSSSPDDGGLIVFKGAHLLSEQFHREMA